VDHARDGLSASLDDEALEERGGDDRRDPVPDSPQRAGRDRRRLRARLEALFLLEQISLEGSGRDDETDLAAGKETGREKGPALDAFGAADPAAGEEIDSW
jgi:hypothetical protein